jgi:hypothetical protein
MLKKDDHKWWADKNLEGDEHGIFEGVILTLICINRGKQHVLWDRQ